MWLRKCGQALRVFVPEGLDDRSQAIYCLERATQRTRPVGSGLIGSTGRFFDHGQQICRVAQLTPSPPGRFAFFRRIPGNKLPGYDHPVPCSGQQTSLTTVHKSDATLDFVSDGWDDSRSGRIRGRGRSAARANVTKI